MKVGFCRVLLIAILAAVLCPASLADDPAAIRKAIDAAYAKYTQSYMKKDVKGLLDLTTPDFVWKQGKTIKHRAELESEIKVNLAAVNAFKTYNVRIDAFTPKGDQAIAVITEKFSAIVSQEDGSKQTAKQTSRSRDTWVKTAKGWRMKQSEVLR